MTKEEIDSGHYKDEQKVFESNEFGEKKLKVYPKETFIYRLTGREREKSASYYTPEILAVAPVDVCSQGRTGRRSSTKLPDRKGKKPSAFSSSCGYAEPALGSATFFERSRQPTRRQVHGARTEGPEVSASLRRTTTGSSRRVKMYLADNNVYGVDLNPVAVELAQVCAVAQCALVRQVRAVVRPAASQRQFDHRLRQARLQGRLRKGRQKIRISAAHELSGTRGEDEIWQFLLPDFEMATYKDADFKKVYKTQIDTLNKKVKAFNTALSGNELEILQGLSAAVDEHWGRWAEDLAKIRPSTDRPRMPFTGTLRPSARFSPIRKE
ncbi:MAG: hypothetical protein ACLUNV_08470 [Sutterella wadsworthensis]